MDNGYYDRPMVARLSEIFDHPKRPDKVYQNQFDDAQEALERTAKKEWHEIDQSDYWHYLLDLCYVDLQQDLFDYLFPAFLIRWWEGLVSRRGGPESECDFYRAIDHGNVLSEMMDRARRTEILEWMVDAYIEGVDSWGGKLSVDYDSEGPDNLHGPLWSFNAIGQSIPITRQILDELDDVSTEGRAQWWLILATGLIWNEDQVDHVPPWDEVKGGGGIYITQSAAAIYDHGYIDENLATMRARITFETLVERLRASAKLLKTTPNGVWAEDALFRLQQDPARIEARIDRLMHLLSLEYFGGALTYPLEQSSGEY